MGGNRHIVTGAVSFNIHYEVSISYMYTYLSIYTRVLNPVVYLKSERT